MTINNQKPPRFRIPNLVRKLREDKRAQGFVLISPTLFYLLIFMIVPMILVLIISVMTRGTYGNIEYRFSLESYSRLIDPLYFRVLRYTILTAGLTTIITILIGYPLAYYIARVNPRQRTFLLFLILVPFWTNFLIRIYAWIMILRTEGVLNNILFSLNLINTPLEIFATPLAVQIGMVYEFLPFMILPLYTSLEKIENSQLEAAADLGARPWRAFLRVTLPLSIPGIIAGSILVFIPAMGMFVIPDLMGGARNMLVGNLIRNQFMASRDWPFGSAASVLLLLLTLVVTLIYTRKAGFKEDILL